jgi:hypothetical protein
VQVFAALDRNGHLHVFFGWLNTYNLDWQHVGIFPFEQTIESSTQLTMVTAHGKALVPESATNYQDLRQVVARISELTPSGPITDNPATVYVYAASAMGGIVIGWMITPMKASDTVLIGCVLGGAVVGPLLAMLILRVLGSAAHSPLLLPAVGGVIGGIFGLSLLFLNTNPGNLALQPMAFAIGKPMLVGLVLGYLFLAVQIYWFRVIICCYSDTFPVGRCAGDCDSRCQVSGLESCTEAKLPKETYSFVLDC